MDNGNGNGNGNGHASSPNGYSNGGVARRHRARDHRGGGVEGEDRRTPSAASCAATRWTSFRS